MIMLLVSQRNFFFKFLNRFSNKYLKFLFIEKILFQVLHLQLKYEVRLMDIHMQVVCVQMDLQLWKI